MADLVIRGDAVDIAIEDGRFAAIGPQLPGCAKEIDARGMAILPGLIDVHVHFNEPGRTDWEGIATGSRALAAGGGTFFFDMPLNSSPCTLDGPSFDLKHAAMTRSAVTDFALWGGLTPTNLHALDELAARGVIGFKAFMSDSGLPEFVRADDRTLYEGMRTAARWNLPVAVHAENNDLTKPRGTSLRDYLESRPVIAELEAIQRAALLAKETGARLHIVHVSSGRGVALAAELRAGGVDLTIETCPHYLYFTEEDMERLGAVAKCAPPLRSNEERESLWTHLNDIDIIASDHSPSDPALKKRADFSKVWGGIAGVQSTLNVLLDRVPLERIAELTAAAPAKRFGLRDRGRIEVGCYADCALVDRTAPFVLEANHLFYRHKLSPYVGCTFRATVRRTILRGRTIFQCSD